jgi:hypothetical protein
MAAGDSPGNGAVGRAPLPRAAMAMLLRMAAIAPAPDGLGGMMSAPA